MHEAMKTAVLRLISARAVIGMNRTCTPRSFCSIPSPDESFGRSYTGVQYQLREGS